MFKGHPKGLIAAALANMGERFGYYIMNAVLVLFLWWEALSPTVPRITKERFEPG